MRTEDLRVIVKKVKCAIQAAISSLDLLINFSVTYKNYLSDVLDNF